MPRPSRPPSPTGRRSAKAVPEGAGPKGVGPKRAAAKRAGPRGAPAMAQPSQADQPSYQSAPKMLRITGLPAVKALFERNPRLVERLFFDERNAAAVNEYCGLLAKARKPYRQVDADELARVAGTVL